LKKVEIYKTLISPIEDISISLDDHEKLLIVARCISRTLQGYSFQSCCGRKETQKKTSLFEYMERETK